MMRCRFIDNRKVRGICARQYMCEVFKNPDHPMYTASDVALASKLHVTRLTVLNIRRELDLKCRNLRVIDLLQKIDTTRLTIKELAAKLCLKYQNTHKLLRKLGLETLQDKKPIEAMIEYQRSKNKRMKEYI